MKEIIAVYQDCVLCGVKGKQKIDEYAEKGIAIRKVGFTTPEGRELCAKAVALGIGYMPFYTDGEKFAKSIEDFMESSEPVKKNKKVRKEKKDGAVSKD